MNQSCKPLQELTVERLRVKVFGDRMAMGRAAGLEVADRIRALQKEQQHVTMMFAAAPSQNEFLETLASQPGIDWQRIIALHLDEYVGLPEDAPQSFRTYLRGHLFSLVNPGRVHLLKGEAADPAEECRRYAELIVGNPVDIACIGIGENGHLAFNDPPVADFLDPEAVKVVELDQVCRNQQVNDGCFPALGKVPTHAFTVTIPTIMSARYIHCIVPGPTKSEAVRRTLKGEVSTACPATILRRHLRAVLYLDRDSASQLV